MIRLSGPHARMRLSSAVELRDVQEAYRLMRDAIRTSALDPTTGKIDMGLHNTGMGQRQRKLREDMQKEALGLLGVSAAASSRGIRWTNAIQQLANQSSIRSDAGGFKEVISAMEAEELVRVVGEREANDQVGGSLSWILESFMLSCCSLPHFLCYHHH